MQQHVTVTRSTCNSAYRLSTFPMFSKCKCDPSNAHTQTLFERTARATGSAPWQTTSNWARPSSTRGAYLARFTQCSHSHAALPPSTIQASRSSAVSERTARRPGATRPRRQRDVSVIVNLPHHNRARRPQTSQCRFRALRAAK